MAGSEHISKKFDQELSQLKRTILDMMTLSASQVKNAIEALTTGNEVLAARTIARDAKVNRLQEAVDSCTLRLLAMRQPVANDLRFIMACQRMADDLERVADYAGGVAKRTLEQAGRELGDPVETMGRMGAITLDMLDKVRIALEESDLDLALLAWEQDDEVDRLYTEAIRELGMIMSQDTDCVEPCMALLTVAKAIERIGDHITNLAEGIYFSITGDRHLFTEKKG